MLPNVKPISQIACFCTDTYWLQFCRGPGCDLHLVCWGLHMEATGPLWEGGNNGCEATRMCFECGMPEAGRESCIRCKAELQDASGLLTRQHSIGYNYWLNVCKWRTFWSFFFFFVFSWHFFLWFSFVAHEISLTDVFGMWYSPWVTRKHQKRN